MKRRLVPDRWAMEILHALRDRDDVRLSEVINQLPDVQINAVIQKSCGGAPFEFAGEGFFDSRAKSYATPYFNVAKDGDTLLTVALREKNPLCALVLITHGAELLTKNGDNETPLDIAWNAYLSLENDSNSPLNSCRVDYERLFTNIKPHLISYHRDMQDRVRSKLESIYRKYAPERIEKIESQLQVFYGKEDELLLKVRQKYET